MFATSLSFVIRHIFLSTDALLLSLPQEVRIEVVACFAPITPSESKLIRDTPDHRDVIQSEMTPNQRRCSDSEDEIYLTEDNRKRIRVRRRSEVREGRDVEGGEEGEGKEEEGEEGRVMTEEMVNVNVTWQGMDAIVDHAKAPQLFRISKHPNGRLLLQLALSPTFSLYLILPPSQALASSLSLTSL